MLIGVITQQPADRLDYDISMTGVFDASDPVANVSLTVTPAGSLVATAVIINDTTIKIWLSGGADGDFYKIDITSISTETRIKQDELEVYIEEY